MGRAPCCDKANVKKGPWSPEEDAKLKAYIEKYGTGGNWIALPQKIGLKRCGKSCRLRWLNYLRPNIKHGGFTEEEDNIICSLYISIGSRWSIIAAQLPGRTDNDIKNYWNTRLKKKLLGRRKQSSTGFINNPLRDTRNEVMEDSNNINALSNSALERLQLHMQLQALQNQNNQNPFSNFYLWPTTPKLHPPMMSTGNDNNNNENPTDDSQKHDQQEYEKTNASSSMIPLMDPMENHQQVSALQAELHEIILSNNNNMSMIQDHQDQMADFDCFAEMNSSDSKDNNLMNMWWSSSNNDLMAKSGGSSSSWGSSTSTSTTTPVALQPEVMFQDNYELVVDAYSL